jgi:hypothetical protein
VVINHVPVTQSEKSKEITIKCVITSPNGVYLPTVFYRLKGEAQYFPTPLIPVPEQGGDLYATAIPGLFFIHNIEYYIEARDLKNFTESTQVGSPDKPIEITAVDKKAQEPHIAVTSEPAGADIAMDGKLLGRTPYLGTVEPGEHTLVLSKDKYKTAQKTINATEGRELDLPFPLAETAKPPVLAVVTEPMGARVTLGEKELGMSPLLQEAPLGAAQISIWKEGFQKQVREVSLTADRNTEISVTLQKLPPEPVLAVVTQPAGSVLTVDGTEVGKTPFLGPLKAGPHELSLSREGFRGLGVEVVMPSDRDLDLRYNLEPQPAVPPPPQVAIGTDPAGATVEIDAQPAGASPMLKELAPGDHVLTLKAKGFVTYQRKLFMPKDHDIEVSVAMVAEPPPPGPSAVDITVDPATADVKVDDKLTGKGGWSGKRDAGEHVVEVHAPGFRALTQKFVIQQGQGVSMKLALTPLPPEAKAPFLSVVSEPKGATVLLDGKEIGKAPYEGETTPGEHTVTLVLPEYKDHVEKVKIPDDREFELRIRASLAQVRKSVVMPQVNKKEAAPTPDAKQAIEARQAEDKRKGVVTMSLQPTPLELESMCAKGAPTAAAAAPTTVTKEVQVKTVERQLLRPGLVPIVATAVGLVAVGVGGYFAYHAQSVDSDLKTNTDVTKTDSLLSDYSRSQKVSYILFGAGGGLAGGVDVYWLLRSYVFNGEETPEEAKSKEKEKFDLGAGGP